MKILIDAGQSTGQMGGIGKHTSALVQYLQDIRCHQKNNNAFSLMQLEYPLVGKWHRSLARLGLLTLMNTWLQTQIVRKRITVAHFVNYAMPVWKWKRCKYVVTIHDLAAWDIPETLPKAYVPYIRWTIRNSIKRADAIITHTQYMADRIKGFFKNLRCPIYVIPDGIRDSVVTQTASGVERRRTILFVGSVEFRRNLPTVVKAMSMLPEACGDIRFIIAGRQHEGMSEILDEAGRLGFSNRIEMRGVVSEGQLSDLYAESGALVMPSYYEGFGIPIIEAMACGLPIIASNNPVFQEVGGDVVHYYGDPQDAQALARTIETVFNQPGQTAALAKRGVERSKQFRWDTIAQQHLDVYRKTL